MKDDDDRQRLLNIENQVYKINGDVQGIKAQIKIAGACLAVLSTGILYLIFK